MKFLKPTKWKIIFTLLMPLYCTYTVQYQMAIPPEKSIWYQIVFYPIPLLLFYLSAIFNRFSCKVHPLFSIEKNFLHFYLDFIVPTLLNYLIICVSFFLFSKFKKNIKKSNKSLHTD